MPYKKIIAIPDIQAPKHDPTAVSTAIKIVKGERPDILVHIGDFVDFQSISRFAKRDWTEAQLTADKEIASANKILDRFDHVTPKKSKVIFLEGNHERRLELFIIKNASKLGSKFAGLSIQEQLKIEERGYKYVPINDQPYHIGKLGFVHGWYTNLHHSKAHVEKGGQSLIYGHAHDAQLYTGMHLDSEQPRMAMSIGCLCDYRQAYLEGKPSNWAQGVAIIYVDEATGHFWPTFHWIIEGKAVINGKTYKS